MREASHGPKHARHTLERDVARQIDAYLEHLGLRAFRADPGARTARTRPRARGLPDRFGVLPNGRMWAIEVKRPKARLRKDQPKQDEVLAYLRANNALVIVAHSLADVSDWLNLRVIAEHAREYARSGRFDMPGDVLEADAAK